MSNKQTYLRPTVGPFLTNAYTGETITMVKIMNTSILFKSFLLPLIVPPPAPPSPLPAPSLALGNPCSAFCHYGFVCIF